MRVLISIRQFRDLTGAEMYVYELARELKRTGHEPVITAPIVSLGGEMLARAKAAGLTAIPFEGFKLLGMDFEVLHLNERKPSEALLGLFPKAAVVSTVHSQFECEAPILSPRIFKYIAIRQGIKDKLEAKDGIDPARIEIIPNGIDVARFNRNYEYLREQPQDPDARPMVLFVGTFDKLRLEAIKATALYCEKTNRAFRLVGKNHHLKPEAIPANAEIYLPTWDVENHIHACDETAGVMLGRTTIEGWACGKPGWIYTVDEAGKVRAVDWTEPPANMTPYSIEAVAGRIKNLYTEAMEAAK
jgi:glycosyltransferase involved in cell wall biosynthesis